MFDIHDRAHQRDEVQFPLDHREQSADPTAIARPQDSEFVATMFAQDADQLAHFDYSLSQTFGISNQIGGNCEFAVPVTARNARIVIWQMNEARVPSEL